MDLKKKIVESFSKHYWWCWRLIDIVYAFVLLRGFACPPSRNPFRNRRRTNFKKRQRPVPVVFLRFAFSDQLSIQEISKKIDYQI